MSILLMNPYIKKFGYKFIWVDLNTLESKYSGLFSLPHKFQSRWKAHIEEFNIDISTEFYEAYTNNHIIGDLYILRNGLPFLKKIDNTSRRTINKKYTTYSETEALQELQSFSESLVQQFRLLKRGNIYWPMIFQIDKKTRHVTSTLFKLVTNKLDRSIYTLSKEECKILNKTIRKDFASSKLTEMALNNFNLSYEVLDEKTKFITLMTSLECLFNIGKDQIAHTVSRHLSIILSKNTKEFLENYALIKKFYGLRSKIVHTGGSINENINQSVIELQDMARKAISVCLALNINKEELFEKLNCFGFENRKPMGTDQSQ